MVHAIIDGVSNFIETNIQKYPIVEEWIGKIQEKTGIKNRCVIISLVLVPLCLYLVPIMANMLTIIYPLYMSVKSIEKGKNDRTRWLVFWLLFHGIHITDSLCGWALRMVGDITLIKFGYLVWCMAPIEKNGCVLSYGLLKPYITRHIGYADQCISGVTSKVENVLKDNQDLLQGVKEKAINATISSYSYESRKTS